MLRLPPSLRGKIALAYLSIALLTLALAGLAYGQLRLLRERILLGERVAELFETTLEVRRFERNAFLHGQEADFRENAAYTLQLAQLLSRDADDFATLGLGSALPELREEIDTYRQLMAEYAGTATGAEAPARQWLAPRIRATGQRIVAAGETLVAAERQNVHAALSSFQRILLVSVGGGVLGVLLIGRALTRRVVRPLKRIERSVDAVARGDRRSLSLPDDDREIVAIVAAFNHMLRELELRNRHLLRSEKLASMGTMVSGVAHELNNPISNIWSSCQLLLEEPALPADGPWRELLLQIDEQSVRARNIVRALFDFTRERPFRHEDAALDALVAQTLRFLKGEIPVALPVTVDIPAGLTVAADRQRLQQALLNLLRNAVQACTGVAGSGITLSARSLRAEARAADDDLAPCLGDACVEIRIHDDGPGIPPDVLPRIFDPFFTTKDVGHGMGLGLFIAYQIVDEHGGSIAARSATGEGTTFILRLPTHPEPD